MITKKFRINLIKDMLDKKKKQPSTQISEGECFDRFVEDEIKLEDILEYV